MCYADLLRAIHLIDLSKMEKGFPHGSWKTRQPRAEVLNKRASFDFF